MDKNKYPLLARLIQANALHIPLADESVQTCVTSPPYFGLRDYGTAEWVGGDAECDHRHQLGGEGKASAKQNTSAGTQMIQYKDICGKCGASRVDNQIGLEPTLQEYIENICKVMDEVRRVLRPDGTLWLNLGDSYAGSGKGRRADGTHQEGGKQETNRGTIEGKLYKTSASLLKPKDLIGVPWRVALALQERGWWLRSDIIWHKPNPMPESVTDRPTKAHEYIFLLTKNKRYFYDADAIREEAAYDGRHDTLMKGSDKYKDGFVPSQPEQSFHARGHERWPHQTSDGKRGRNKRTVWTVTTKPYSGAHFATFPPDLIEPCILAGTSEKGQCPECGAPWERVIEKKKPPDEVYVNTSKPKEIQAVWKTGGMGQKLQDWYNKNPTTTTGWRPTCEHDHEPVPQIVLDPFGGSGTTAMVAQQHNRIGICLDLSWEYLQLAKQRCGITQMHEFYNGKKAEANWENLPLFKDR